MPLKPIPFKVRDFRNKGFFVIDDAYLNGYAKYLTPSITVIYLSLCRHANKEQSCFPAQKLIAEEHGITERTVRRCLNKLVELRIIKVVRKRSVKGKWLRNTYFLLDKSVWGLPTGHQCPMENQRTSKTKTRGHQRPIKDTHIKDTQQQSVVDKIEKWAYERARATPSCDKNSFRKSVKKAIERIGEVAVYKAFEKETNAIQFLKNIKNL